MVILCIQTYFPKHFPIKFILPKNLSLAQTTTMMTRWHITWQSLPQMSKKWHPLCCQRMNRCTSNPHIHSHRIQCAIITIEDVL